MVAVGMNEMRRWVCGHVEHASLGMTFIRPSLLCRVPTPMMKESLLYKMTQFGYNREVSLDPNRFSHAFTSKFGKCRVFKVRLFPRPPVPLQSPQNL